METPAFISPCLPIKHNPSFSCFLLRTTIDCCVYTLSISLSTTMILNLLLIRFQAWEFGRPFCLRCLHEIANLCATYDQYILPLLLFVLLPLQSHFTPLPSKQNKKAAPYLTKGWRSKRQLSKSFTVEIQPLATRLKKKKNWYLDTGGHTNRQTHRLTL